VSLVNITSGYF